ncbi:hypothetical protein Bca4012_067435 [Brassica carinata]
MWQSLEDLWNDDTPTLWSDFSDSGEGKDNDALRSLQDVTPIELQSGGRDAQTGGKDLCIDSGLMISVNIQRVRIKTVELGKANAIFWGWMCKDIEHLFFDVDEDSLGSLETLSITNLQLLETVSSNDSFKNLKKLSIDCCPNIKTFFPVVDQVPSSLEVLHIKCCENLEKVFEESQVSTLTTLCLHDFPVLSALGAKLPNLEIFKKSNCPNLQL